MIPQFEFSPVPADWDEKATSPRWSRLAWTAFAMTLLFITASVTGIYLFVAPMFVGLVDAPGWRARRVLSEMWPERVSSADVQSVSYMGESSRDSSSTFLRVGCDIDIARKWETDLRQDHQETSEWLDTFSNNLVETRHHSQPDIPLREVTGQVPAWWTPPAGNCVAHQSMIWYRDSDSGVARAVYSLYDKPRKTLWVYSYTCQHDELWKRGQVDPTFGNKVPVDALPSSTQ